MNEISDEDHLAATIDSPPPNVLFKFRRFPSLQGLAGSRMDDANSQREVVFNILSGQLRMAKPDSFNDPFEFRPAVKLVDGPPKQQASSARKYIRRVARDYLPFKRRLSLLRNPAQIDRIAENLPALTAASLANMRNKIEIYCLSANERRPLLWSHYADGHRGIAIHMDATRLPFRLAWKVEYSRQYPEVLAGSGRSPSENWERLRKSLLVKDEDWQYEEEFRFLAPQSAQSVQMLLSHGVTHADGYLYVPQNTVVGITLGAKMPGDAEADLLAFIREQRPDVFVRRARLGEGRFEIDVVAS